MKGSIFGRRKWIGLWLVVLSVMGYSLAAKVAGIPLEIAGKVIWAVVSAYGVYVTGNAASKILGGPRDRSKEQG